jgi:hypothetical protein
VAPSARAEAQNQLLLEALGRYGRVRIRARGHSMRPLIPDGSLVELRPLRGDPCGGEVVAAFRGATLLIHRVVRVAPEGVTLAGDGARAADPMLPPDAVFGVAVRATLPGGWQVRLDNLASRCLGRVIAATHIFDGV